MKTRVFVYGTLKTGLGNHGWLRGHAFLGRAVTEPLYRMFDLGGYPGMVAVDEGGLPIEGEVWEVDERGLRLLDKLEGVAEGEYALEPVTLHGEWNGQGVMTYLYLRPVAGRRDAGACWRE